MSMDIPRSDDKTEMLGERLKELECLHSISSIIATHPSLPAMLEDIVKVIPPAFHYPQLTSCSITYRSLSYSTDSEIEAADRVKQTTLKRHIRVAGNRAGSVTVTLKLETSEAEAVPFLPEEKQLLSSVAERIGHEAERLEYLEKLQEQEEKSRATLHAIGDGVIAADSNGYVTLLNPIAQQLTGWKKEEAIGSPLQQVFNIVHTHTGEPAVNPFETVLRTGTVQGLANHTTLIAQDGTTYQIADSAAPIHDERGNVIGVIIVFRDVSKSYQTIEALKKSEERFSKAFLTSPYVIAITRLSDGKILEVNEAVTRMFGYSREEAVSSSTLELNIWRQPKQRKEFRSRLERGEIIRNMEVFFRRKDGNTVIGSMNAQVIELEQTPCIITSIDDITQERSTEQALKSSEDILKAVISCSQLAIFSIDEEGSVLTWNKASERIFGWSADEIIGKPLPIIPANKKDEFAKLRKKVKDGSGFTGLELQRLRKDGRLIDIRLSTAPLHGAGNSVTGIMATAEDVTDQKRTEKKLVREETNRKKLEFVINNSPVVVFLWKNSPGWPIDYVSENIKQFGYTPGQFYSGDLSYADIIHPDDSEQVTIEVNRHCRSTDQDAFSQTYRIKTASGQVRWVEDRSWIQRDKQGNCTQLQGTVTDITEQKKTQQERDELENQLTQAQKMESIGRLAGGVAHDYNNMLSVVLGYTELALQQAQQAGQNELYRYLLEINHAAERTSKITDRLLAFARKQTVVPKVVNINETIDQMLKMLRRLIGEEVELTWQPASQLWPVRIDPVQIDQILANLCINARDAIAGVGKITIETDNRELDGEFCRNHPDCTPGKYVMLRVSDNGCGMDEHTLENLFEPFFTNKDPGIGTGLGLSMVYGVIKQNNGLITVDSKPGTGSTFTIFLPKVEHEQPQIDREKEDSIPAGNGETILLVEDDRSIRLMTKQLLTKLGYVVYEAESPQKAVEVAKKHGGTLHLVLTDVVMPQKNGRELANELTAAYPDLKVLFMSGYTADVIAKRGIVDHTISFIHKPFTIRELAKMVSKALEA